MSGDKIDHPPVAGVLLAGGKARRMGGGDKGLKKLGGRTLIERIAERASGQVATLIINSAGDPTRFSAIDAPVVADVIPDQAGPLAGVLTGLEWFAEHNPEIEWVATFATDAPFIPDDLVSRLMAAVIDVNADMACARSGGRVHPVFGLWPVRLRGALRKAMVDEDIRKIDLWTARFKLVHVDFGTDPVDPFFNINRPEDLAAAELKLSRAV